MLREKKASIPLDDGFFAAPPVWVGASVFIALTILGLMAHPVGTSSGSLALSTLIELTAFGLGVIAASLASPGETSEGAMFKLVAAVLVAFASTFVVKFFEIEIKVFGQKIFAGDIVSAVRFWMFVSAFVAAAIFSYVFRAYFMSKKPISVLAREIDADIAKVQDKVRKLAHASEPPQSSNPLREPPL